MAKSDRIYLRSALLENGMKCLADELRTRTDMSASDATMHAEEYRSNLNEVLTKHSKHRPHMSEPQIDAAVADVRQQSTAEDIGGVRAGMLAKLADALEDAKAITTGVKMIKQGQPKSKKPRKPSAEIDIADARYDGLREVFFKLVETLQHDGYKYHLGAEELRDVRFKIMLGWNETQFGVHLANLETEVFTHAPSMRVGKALEAIDDLRKTLVELKSGKPIPAIDSATTEGREVIDPKTRDKDDTEVG